MQFRWAYLLQGVKVAAGAAAAILLAQVLQLQFGITAGIITVLAILGTKKETLTIAAGRLMAFLGALVIVWGCYTLLGFTVAGFGVYLFLFAVLCYICRWSHAIAMVSVLMSHFLTFGVMTPALILNEALLLLIGTACGVAVNLHLRPDDKRLASLIDRIDAGMKQLLEHLSRADTGSDDAEIDHQLEELAMWLKQAGELAVTNANNRLLGTSMQEMRYLSMRGQQRKILGQITAGMGKLRRVPFQWQTVSCFF